MRSTTAVAAIQLGVLKGYQLDRFGAFLDPTLDPRGAGYNTTQARIAIGNGGLFGQGLFHGSQTQSGFVPEQHTDFVFTVAGEELGLVGAGALIALFLVLLWRAVRIAAHADDMFGRLAGAGIVCWFGFQAFQNIGMCLGIMPVTGVPLPLVSYGGTSMFASLMAVGLLLNIHLRTERVARSRRGAPRPDRPLPPHLTLPRRGVCLVNHPPAWLTRQIPWSRRVFALAEVAGPDRAVPRPRRRPVGRRIA